ncbi:MAG: FadR family transcriptional regulator [Lachnospiraceae bacterium]|nr:FadR family transcriptional regulator [Lachnospiraceae bacterium]
MDMTVQQVQKNCLYENVASQIEEKLLRHPENVGEPLPSEQTLADNFGVSRNVIREAFKVLKERGFIDVRNGSGAYVTRPGRTQVTEVLTRVIRADAADPVELFEVRFALEVSAAELAASRADRAAAERIRHYAELTKENRGNADLWGENDFLFHRELVAATGNTIFLSLFESISSLLKEYLINAWSDPKAVDYGIRNHFDIADAVLAGDPEKAVSVMKAHLKTSLSQYEADHKAK